ncbi:MAG: prolipoprotein diacylglyceryl transferase [Treponema sp.]|jgi:phosphatidylglycerol:prolipoprotein diacylglycerol transferase|nr:prolipoprotein diacylglyceryl transferase [Treponema sp.]
MPLSIPFPSWLKPEIIPGLPFRWYGLMYIVAFGAAFLLYRKQVRERRFPMTDDQLSALFFWGILALLAGARLFAAFVYDTSGTYYREPWLVFWPFRNGRFTGLQGMSYHGGVIGGIVAIIVYSKVKGFEFRETGDMFAASIPLGYTAGRLGNFINGELYGRFTRMPWGMTFPQGGIAPGDSRYAAIKAGAESMGFDVPASGVINLPRHPSQLYEMLLEGVLLWIVIWIVRNRKPFKGFLISLYIGGYGLVRFFLEYFREPDADMGYPLQFVKTDLPPALGHPALCFSTGQLLCLGMIAAAVVWGIIARRLPNSAPVRVYPPAGAEPAKSVSAEERSAARNSRRKLRRNLRRR